MKEGSTGKDAMSKPGSDSHRGSGNGAGDNAGHQSPAGADNPGEPYSASKHTVQGAAENVGEAKEAVSKAADSMKDLLTGKGNMVDAALAVKGAYDNVVGLTGRLSSTAMMPVMKALAAFKGQAILPSGKQMDPVMGIDVHMVIIPPAPAPVPMPHPYIGILFNAKDWVSCAINTFKQDILGALPPPAEDDKSTMASIAKNKEAIAGIAMGLAGLSASVKFGDFVPRAVTGTPVKVVPHIPMGAGFHPGFSAAVSKNHGKAFLGSLFVVADGDPMVGSFHLNYDCWDIGIVDLFKSRRAGAKKATPPSGTGAELFVPSGTVLPIPWGRPVLVNSIPTPINPMNILDKVFKAGLGKLKKAGRKAIQKGLDKLQGKIGCSVLTAVSKAIGTGQSHPVDVSGGHFYTDNIDFSLPGPIPLSWERTWYSYSDYKGPLGYGWHHTYDMALAVDHETMKAALRMSDGRVTTFDLPTKEKSVYNRSEKLMLHLHEDNYYYVTDIKNLIYRFTEKEFRNPFNNTSSHLLQSIANRNGFAIRLSYDSNTLLTQIIDSAGRILKVINDDSGHIITVLAPHPDRIGDSFAITSYTYTNAGDMSAQVDALNQPMYFEYEHHLMVKEIWRNGLNWLFRYDKKSGIDAKCIEVWGDGDLLHYKFDYSSPEFTVVINSLGFKKIFYHKNGVVIKYVDPKGAIWEYRYNQSHELECETDPLGNESTYHYDEWGNVTTSTDPCGGFNQAKYTNKDYPYLATFVTDRAGGKWTWVYDDHGNLLKKINPLGNIIQCYYTDGMLSKSTNAVFANTIIEYDHHQNVIKIETENHTSVKYTYDLLGNCVSVVNPNGILQKREFNKNNKLVMIRDFDGNIINIERDGMDNVILYQDKHAINKFSYNKLGSLTLVSSGDTSVSFKYNTEGNLLKITNENHAVFNFELDAVGKVVKQLDFENNTRKYNRNHAGWITETLHPSGKTSKYEYDCCGRVIQIEHDNSEKQIFGYRLDGELMQASNSFANIEFCKDEMGNILKETVNNDWVAYEYDIMGNKIATRSSLGANILQEINKMGDVVRIEGNGWSAKSQFDKLGMEVERLLPGGLELNWQRDGIGRPTFQTLKNSLSSIAYSPRNTRYSWDTNNRLLQIKDEKGVTSFEYDAWQNLSKTIFDNGEEQVRSSDAVGNIFATFNRQDREYGKNGQLKIKDNWKYQYDKDGNLIEKKNRNEDCWKYEWNNSGMLSKVVRPDGMEVSFGYDALGRRLFKHLKNTVTKFVWNGNVLLHEFKEDSKTGRRLETSNLESGITTWIFENSSFKPLAKIKNERGYSIVTDHIGTPCKMFREDGNLDWECSLDSYGKIRMENGDINSCKIRYQGQYDDSEIDLYYNRFRYYDPSAGNYISSDPIGLASNELNFYRYVFDPNIVIDPLGLAMSNGAAANAAEWQKAEQEPARPGPGIRNHYGNHGEDVGANSAREYDASARNTIRDGNRFTYKDRFTGEARVGYHDPATGLFTATTQKGKKVIIHTHFPETWENLRRLPKFACG